MKEHDVVKVMQNFEADGISVRKGEWGTIVSVMGNDTYAVELERRPVPEVVTVWEPLALRGRLLRKAARAPVVKCCLCGHKAEASKAHLHQGEWIGDECCWDERLKASE